MAGHPAAVRTFLLKLLDAVKAPAIAELDGLQRLVQQTSSKGLQAWDQHFYRHLALVGSHSRRRSSDHDAHCHLRTHGIPPACGAERSDNLSLKLTIGYY